jgi:hypothetical protein
MTKYYSAPLAKAELRLYYLPLNMDTIQIIIAITTITEIMPTTAPALKMPAIAEQLLKHNTSKMSDGKYSFFMGECFYQI